MKPGLHSIVTFLGQAEEGKGIVQKQGANMLHGLTNCVTKLFYAQTLMQSCFLERPAGRMASRLEILRGLTRMVKVAGDPARALDRPGPFALEWPGCASDCTQASPSHSPLNFDPSANLQTPKPCL